jgi:2-keto-4-pentenoate hydratase/2-oxohepta-3-ene-1,7-dioic acid hydratase in catechol pathway
MNLISYKGRQLEPSKVVCVGRNYAAHIAELKNQRPDQPVIFLKPNSAISNQLSSAGSEPVHYESEISFLIIDGRLSGVAFGLDLTKREIQSELKAKGLPWERAKAFDRSAVFSEFVMVSESVGSLRLELEINGCLVQQGGINEMIFSPSFLVDDIASFISFEDGDILMTGTPSGVGVVKSGDLFVGRIFDDNLVLVEQEWRVGISPENNNQPQI